MELLRPFATTQNQIFGGVSAFCFTPSSATLHNKTRSKLGKSPFKPLPCPSFATSSRLPNCKIFHITARLGRPSRRRNSLRKKLTHESQCIEQCTYEGEDQQVGFYSLEMAEDLDINPKPSHVIAFEDPGDCKNLCYIIQAHFEMLGKGQAFVVAETPKDAFRQAKANGFSVTVVRKGELQLNIDQPLEEVEELIPEIGSKMYHDKLMKERSVVTNALMKGVLGVSGPSKRRKKQALKRPRKL